VCRISWSHQRNLHSGDFGIIPGNLHYEVGNPQIPFEEWRIKVPTKLTNWPVNGIRRLSVNSFGYGGTNAHAILDDACHYLAERGLKGNHNTTVKPISGLVSTNDHIFFGNSINVKLNRHRIRNKPKIFAFNAHDEHGLSRVQASFFTHINARSMLGDAQQNNSRYFHDLAFTLSNRRSPLPWKAAIIASSMEELTEGLSYKDKTISFRSIRKPRVGFVFTGQGAQWARMGIDLCCYEVFRASIEQADQYLSSNLGCRWSTMEELCREDNESKINRPEYSQALCTVLQVALVDLLESWNITPVAVVGHSSGEIAAAYCLGALSRQDA
jgi:zearalenone synthase (highly reducing iterative type I polyketide synthase)